MVPAAVIPLVGSAIIWGPAAAYLLLTGHVGAGVGLILWGGVRVSLIDNVLKPLLVKGSRPTFIALIAGRNHPTSNITARARWKT